MGLPRPVKRYTPQEYYSLEREAAYKSDYYDGEIFAMAGGTIKHSLICGNLIREAGNRLKGKPCTVFESNLRLKIQRAGLLCYPDMSIYCGSLEYDKEDPNHETVTNPTLLFEVLSPSTEAYDRGFKAANYREIESLRAYVLVSQTAPHVEMYTRHTDGAWLLREIRGLSGVLSIPSIPVDLPLAEIYDRVDFTATESDVSAVRALTPHG